MPASLRLEVEMDSDYLNAAICFEALVFRVSRDSVRPTVPLR